MTDNIRIFPAETFARDVVLGLKTFLAPGLKAGENPRIALPGGRTPEAIGQELAKLDRKDGFFQHQCLWFQADERDVPPDHPECNQKMIRDHFFVGAKGEAEINFFPVRVYPGKPDLTAFNYEKKLREKVPSKKQTGVVSFDLVILGLGEDGHVGSLFPELPWKESRGRNFLPFFVEKLNSWRYSLSWAVLMEAAGIFLWVTGESKAEIVERILTGKGDDLPPGQLAKEKKVVWWLDEGAASRLPGEFRRNSG